MIADSFLAALLVCFRFFTEAEAIGATPLLRRQQGDADANASVDGAWSHRPVASALETGDKHITIFCFAWFTRRPQDERILPEIKRQYAKCDGRAIFTDIQAPGPDDPDIIKVPVPDQRCNQTRCVPRENNGWLYHKNMAGLLPAWTYLLEGRRLDKYDWVINSEFDHYMRPTMIRKGIETYMTSLWRGGRTLRNPKSPLMLMFGNVFLFNAEMVQEMRRQWSLLGKQMKPGTTASGCPDWWSGKVARVDCSQDEIYEIMALQVMRPPIPSMGQSGCGKPTINLLGQPLLAQGLACWQMDQSPAGGNQEKEQLNTIRAIASGKLPRVPSPARSPALVEQQIVDLDQSPLEKANNSEQHERYPVAFPDVSIPVIHHVKFASVHALAQQLLPL